MVKAKLYNSGRELFEDSWKHFTKEQKVRLLKATNAHPSWAVTKSPKEMVKRGGGLVVIKLGRLFDEYVKRKPIKDRNIIWR